MIVSSKVLRQQDVIYYYLSYTGYCIESLSQSSFSKDVYSIMGSLQYLHVFVLPEAVHDLMR